MKLETKYHDFSLGDGWFGNIEYTIIGKHYKGVMYVTSEYSENESWVEELDEYFQSEEMMIDYCEKYIRVNNT